MTFGSKLREIRTLKKFTQERVSKDIGISITAISQYENDCRFPNEEVLRKICQYYSVSADYLLNISSDKNYNDNVNSLTTKQKEIINSLIKIIQKANKNEN